MEIVGFFLQVSSFKFLLVLVLSLSKLLLPRQMDKMLSWMHQIFRFHWQGNSQLSVASYMVVWLLRECNKTFDT